MAALSNPARDRLLLVMAKGPVIASYANKRMLDLQALGLVESVFAYQPTGRASPSKVWILTDAGKSTATAALRR